jgi:hypothetical protein
MKIISFNEYLANSQSFGPLQPQGLQKLNLFSFLRCTKHVSPTTERDHRKRPQKETTERDHRKRPQKETTERDHRKRP